MSTFAERLRAIIDESGLRDTEVAERASLDPADLFTMLGGTPRGPTVSTLHRLLAVLPNADARWLICGGQRRKSFRLRRAA